MAANVRQSCGKPSRKGIAVPCDASLCFDIDLVLPGARLQRRIEVPDGPMRLSDLVPLARSLADQLTYLAAQNAAAEGLTVTCHKGCSGCCEHLIPLSVPEAFRLWDELQSLDSTQREGVLGSFMVSARRLLLTPPS